jgi:hypothetical protein
VTGGSINANGQIGGDVQVSGGSINFGSTAVVRGVLQKTGGGVRIAEGASVRSGPSGISTSAGTLGNLGTLFVAIPLVVIAVLVFLTATRAGRAPAPPAAAEQGASDASPTAGRILSSAPRVKGLGNVILGVIVIAIGLLTLFQEFLNLDVWHYAWPLLLLLPGLFCFAVIVFGGGNAGRLAMPGSVLTMLGLLFLFQNAFDQFDSWAYAWALIFPTAIGIGHYVEGWWNDRPALRERGSRETMSGLVIFVLLGAFFELYLNQSGLFRGDVSRYVFPILLILIGVVLIISRLINWPAPSTAAATPGTGKPSTPQDSDQQYPGGS